MRGIYWAGLTGLAAVGGVLIHSDDIETMIDGSDRAVMQVEDRVDRSLDQVDRRIDAMDRRVDRMINDIDRRVDRAIDGSNPVFVEQMAILDDAVERGEIDQGEAIDLAVERTVALATGEPLPPLPVGEPAEASAEGVDRLSRAETQLEALRDANLISQEDYSSIMARIGEAKERASAR